MRKNKTLRYLLISIAIFTIAGLLVTCTIVIGAGEVGVKFNLLDNGIQQNELQEGIHLKAPWVIVDKFNVKTQQYSASEGEMRTVTKEGLYIDLDMTVLYRIDCDKADEIRQGIGRDGEYQNTIITPTVRNSVREIVSNYNADAIYGKDRPKIEKEIQEKITNKLETRNIIVEGVMIRDVGLPAQLTTAIEKKKTAEQDALKMEYILQQEMQEKERKIIEAQGIAEANAIIAGSLDDNYLSWYWIDNLDKHDSVIYVPVNNGGMPLFKEVSEVSGTS